jgi:hypothetical protein
MRAASTLRLRGSSYEVREVGVTRARRGIAAARPVRSGMCARVFERGRRRGRDHVAGAYGKVTVNDAIVRVAGARS